MRRHTHLVLLLVLALVASSLITAPPASFAQDGPGTPPPILPPDDEPDDEWQVVSLPFGDSFDTDETGWLPGGAWVFDTAYAYEGTGWYLDGGPRSLESILEYQALLDLSGPLGAQLIFRQSGSLPTTDLITIEVSLNGGATWVPIDQQIGIETDWEQRIVDLTRFRNLVVRLRFRVNAGAQLSEDEPVSGFYALDNLALQFFTLPDPALVLLPPDQGPRTLLGLHLIVGARQEPVVELASRLRTTGWPLGTLKGTNGTESILAAVKAVSPETITVFRSLLVNGTMIDCPDTSRPPDQEARDWMQGLQPHWNGVQADYFEIINECTPPMDWLAAFSIEAMHIANMQGRCLLLFSFSTGTPEPYQFAQLLPVYQYALQNPCRPDRYHGIALHSYGLAPYSQMLADSGIGFGFRHRLFYQEILTQLPEAIYLPVYITEAGQADGAVPLTCSQVVADVLQYTQQLEYDPYVRGFHLWNFGPGERWIDLTHCLPELGDALVNYYQGR